MEANGGLELFAIDRRSWSNRIKRSLEISKAHTDPLKSTNDINNVTELFLGRMTSGSMQSNKEGNEIPVQKKRNAAIDSNRDARSP